jgi:molybdopterin/thiamine biosynthesis adenylyltransferase
MRLDDEQIERYSRQLILQEVGPRGQERLLAARVAVVGTDAAAERVVAYLAAAGVGAIVAAA